MRAGRSVLGVVYDPVADEMFYAEQGGGAFLNGERLPIKEHVPHLRNAMANVDFKRLPKALARAIVAAPPFASQRNYGAGTLEWCYVAAGRFDVYLHGGQKLWDYAAGCLILEEAGGTHGQPRTRRFLGREPVAALGDRRARSRAVRRLARLGPRAPLIRARRPRAKCPLTA